MSEIKNNLIEEFNLELEGLRTMKIGGEEYVNAIDGTTKLADRIIKIEEQENEKLAIEQELIFEKKDRKIKNGIAIGTAGISLLAYLMSYFISRSDERDGFVQTTEGGRNALKNLLNLRFK